MNLFLSDKTVFLSGSTAGIGFATAKTLAEEGAQVVINGRTEGSVQQALARLREAVPRGRFSGYAADFSHKEEVVSLIRQLPPVDILVNNVGIYRSRTFFEMTDEEWEEQFEVNVMSGVRLSRHFLPMMLENNWGRILFVSSECASLVPEDLIAYSMTKAAILAVSRGLAQLTRASGVTVNVIIPGSTLTEGAEQFLAEVAKKENKSPKEVEKDFFTQSRSSSLLQRFATVDEIASTIAYQASPRSSATNGSAIKVEGGSMGGIFIAIENQNLKQPPVPVRAHHSLVNVFLEFVELSNQEI